MAPRRTGSGRGLLGALGFTVCLLNAAPTWGLELAVDGRARVVITLARDPIPAEITAARELAVYLGRATSAEFSVREEQATTASTPGIFVGPTAFAARAGIECVALGPEEWRMRTTREGLVLCGGRPRGTLYAVYRFLEGGVGVRWWTPHEEAVPRHDRLRVGRLDERGRPAFGYRDIQGISNPGPFLARQRINGHFSRLGPAHGGAERYGPPRQVHTFYDYVPPDELFDTHPDFFSEIAGLRYGGKGQLCLTNPELNAFVAQRMEEYIAQAQRESGEHDMVPRLFEFSQNDWGKACRCARCSALAEHQGGQAGPLIAFLNQLAETIGREHPELLISTLAYSHTFDPPSTLVARENIVVRLTALYQRDFARTVADPINARYREALEGWGARTRHLRIWEYPVTFSLDGELPLPNLPVIAEDYRLYLDHGVEGIFVENGYSIAADMRDLKLWVMAKLLEEPRQPLRPLIVEFTDGYYGAAGRAIRSYLRALEGAARRKPAVLRYLVGWRDYTYLDPEFLLRAQAIFDRAERAVRSDPVLLHRVHHARLSLDHATLIRWSEWAEREEPELDLGALARRYHRTWKTQIRMRLRPSARARALAEVEEEIRYWTGGEGG